MAKQMVFEADAREAIRRGVEKFAKAVTSTLGPRGRNAVLDKGWGAPTITKDGVTVAEEIQLSDPYEQPQDVLRLYYSEQNLLGAVENAVLEEQVVDWALDKANVTDKAMSFNDVIAAASRGGQG